MDYGDDPELDSLLEEAGIKEDLDVDGDSFCIPEGKDSGSSYRLHYGSIRAPRGYSVSFKSNRGNFPVSKMTRKRGTALFWFRHTIPA